MIPSHGPLLRAVVLPADLAIRLDFTHFHYSYLADAGDLPHEG